MGSWIWISKQFKPKKLNIAMTTYNDEVHVIPEEWYKVQSNLPLGCVSNLKLRHKMPLNLVHSVPNGV